MQVILGSGGAIGTELAKVLPEYSKQVRLVARNPKTVVGNEDLVKADLTDQKATLNAVAGAEVAYLCVGLPYHLPTWKAKWPVIMQNVVKACAEHNCKLVFFDNIYMYHPSELGNITEEARKDPQTEKGKVRLQILNYLWEAHESGAIKATVARAADFYGPNAGAVSVINEGVLKPLKAGKPANWFGNTDKKHSFTYTIDAAKGTAILGNSDQSWGEEWHLPTYDTPLTGKEYIETLARLIGAKPKIRVAGKFILGLIGLFNPTMKEFREMLYQYDREYIFNSQKFETAFGFKPTSYQEGLKSLL